MSVEEKKKSFVQALNMKSLRITEGKNKGITFLEKLEFGIFNSVTTETAVVVR
jgi:hypothetical protein